MTGMSEVIGQAGYTFLLQVGEIAMGKAIAVKPSA